MDERNKFFICPMFKNICDYKENQANCFSVEFIGRGDVFISEYS